MTASTLRAAGAGAAPGAWHRTAGPRGVAQWWGGECPRRRVGGYSSQLDAVVAPRHELRVDLRDGVQDRTILGDTGGGPPSCGHRDHTSGKYSGVLSCFVPIQYFFWRKIRSDKQQKGAQLTGFIFQYRHLMGYLACYVGGPARRKEVCEILDVDGEGIPGLEQKSCWLSG